MTTRSSTHSLLLVALPAMMLLAITGPAAPVEPTSVSHQQIVASDGDLADAFGYSVAADADRIVIGMAGDTPPRATPGKVYVLDRQAGGWWSETILTASDDADSREFSYRVALSGDRIVAAGPYGEHVYLFELDEDGTWSETVIASPDSTPGDAFGAAVAIDGDTVVVGAPGDDLHGAASGAAYVFEFTGTAWVPTKLVPSAGAENDEFGWSVAVSGGVVVVGQPHRFCCDPVDSEAAYVFEPDGVGGWVETKLVPTAPIAGESFGFSVATDGQLVVVGAPHPNHSGAAYVFVRHGLGVWTHDRVQPERSLEGDDFGYDVAIDDGRVVVGAPHRYAAGAPGGAHVFSSEPGIGWVEELYQDPGFRDPSDNPRWFGFSVAGSGGSTFVAAPHDDTTTWDAGAVYEFSEALPPPNRFRDDDGNVHEANIEFIAARGITVGCNPPANDRYCPGTTITRGQLSAFLDRALHLPAVDGDWFTDDDTSIFAASINRIAGAGITLGCNPPANDHFCPHDPVTRGEMAAFLARAFHLQAPSTADFFVDDDGSIFEAAIDKLAAAGITFGCNPPANDHFCPNNPVRRDEMASFLARALRAG